MLTNPDQPQHCSDRTNGPTLVSGSAVSLQGDQFCSLEAIWKRADRSNSWGYGNGLVPMFDENGEKIPNKTNPPWPWAVLPDPVIKFGKKQWLISSIDRWFSQMHARARGPAKASAQVSIYGEKGNE